MRSVHLVAGSSFIITEGPSTMRCQHSLFDEQPQNEPRRKVTFGFNLRFLCDVTVVENQILKFDNLQTENQMSVEIVGVIRANPDQPICTDWVLWCTWRKLDTGEVSKFIIHYSTETRLGSGKQVSEFPKY